MRTCSSCKGTGWFDEDDEGFKSECFACEGTGQLDGCICFAREPLECGCDGWSDVDLDEWYGDEE